MLDIDTSGLFEEEDYFQIGYVRVRVSFYENDEDAVSGWFEFYTSYHAWYSINDIGL